MTPEQITRAAKLLQSLATWDKDIAELANATEVAAYARSGGSPVAEFKRSRAKADSWSDDRGQALHHFLMDSYRAGRAKVARELRQLDVAVPEPSL